MDERDIQAREVLRQRHVEIDGRDGRSYYQTAVDLGYIALVPPEQIAAAENKV